MKYAVFIFLLGVILAVLDAFSVDVEAHCGSDKTCLVELSR